MKQRAHIYLHWTELVRVLGLKGYPVKVYSEPDNDYLHIFLEPNEGEEVGPEDGSLEVPPGGYVEGRVLAQVVRDPDILERSGNSYYIDHPSG
jgi:hypothetical protein